jgi:hypothetical protein
VIFAENNTFSQTRYSIVNLQSCCKAFKGKSPNLLHMSVLGNNHDPLDPAVIVPIYTIIRHQAPAIVGSDLTCAAAAAAAAGVRSAWTKSLELPRLTETAWFGIGGREEDDIDGWRE